MEISQEEYEQIIKERDAWKHKYNSLTKDVENMFTKCEVEIYKDVSRYCTDIVHIRVDSSLIDRKLLDYLKHRIKTQSPHLKL